MGSFTKIAALVAGGSNSKQDIEDRTMLTDMEICHTRQTEGTNWVMNSAPHIKRRI